MTTQVPPTKISRSKFPTKHLVTGETIQWEGRPSIIVYFLRSFLLFLFGIMFAIFGWAQSGSTIDLTNLGSYVLFLAMLFLVLLMVGVHRRWGLVQGLISLVLALLLLFNLKLDWYFYFLPAVIGAMAFFVEYLTWSHTFFGISDRRIMTQYGIFNLMFADPQIDRVQNVTVVQTLVERIFGFGDVMFSTAGNMGGIESDDQREAFRTGGAIIWENVPKPFLVRKAAEEIIMRSTRPTVQYVQQPVAVAAPAPAPPVPISSVEAEERLTKLKEMLDKNLITDAEYQVKRQEIIGRM